MARSVIILILLASMAECRNAVGVRIHGLQSYLHSDAAHYNLIFQTKRKKLVLKPKLEVAEQTNSNDQPVSSKMIIEP